MYQPSPTLIVAVAVLLSAGPRSLAAEEDCTARVEHGRLVELRLQGRSVVPPDHREPLWKIELVEPGSKSRIEIAEWWRGIGAETSARLQRLWLTLKGGSRSAETIETTHRG